MTTAEIEAKAKAAAWAAKVAELLAAIRGWHVRDDVIYLRDVRNGRP